MRPIIIDTDPGHDDAMAILMALAYPEKLELRGLTTVAGNQTIDKVTANAIKILSLAKRRVPVAAGAGAPLRRPLETGGFAHGSSGLDGPELPPPAFAPEPFGAHEFLCRALAESAEPLTIVAIGPLTNPARIISERPDLAEKIALVSLMGGGVGGGNMTAAAEFNIYVDPDAARILFNSGRPVVMSGLDVTEKALIYEEEWEALRRRGGRASAFVAELLDFYSLYSKRLGIPGSALHDPCAVAYLLEPGLFSYEDLSVDVETEGLITRGMTLADRRKGQSKSPNVRVLTDLDRGGLVALLSEALERLDRKLG
jgi:pyrimidine-specific ribonucleoside hydrolase